jgi:hypothetical protein
VQRPQLELVRSLGATHVIDYTMEDFTAGPRQYDVILDNVSNLPLVQLRGALTPKGTLVLNGGGSPGHVFGPVAGILQALVANLFVSQRLRPLPSKQKREELLAVTELIEGGKLTPIVYRTYPLADTAEGLSYVEQGHARGKVVITVAGGRAHDAAVIRDAVPLVYALGAISAACTPQSGGVGRDGDERSPSAARLSLPSTKRPSNQRGTVDVGSREHVYQLACGTISGGGERRFETNYEEGSVSSFIIKES